MLNQQSRNKRTSELIKSGGLTFKIDCKLPMKSFRNNQNAAVKSVLLSWVLQ